MEEMPTARYDTDSYAEDDDDVFEHNFVDSGIQSFGIHSGGKSYIINSWSRHQTSPLQRVRTSLHYYGYNCRLHTHFARHGY